MSSSSSVLRLLHGFPDVMIVIFGLVGNEGCMNFIKVSKQVHQAVWQSMVYMRFFMHVWGKNYPNRWYLPNNSWEGITDMVDNRFVQLARLPLTQNIMPLLREPFMKFMHTFMHLEYMKGCGVCGDRLAHVNRFWLIGNTVCHECRCENFISEVRLYDVYGLRLTSLIHQKTFMQWICGKACVVRMSNLNHEHFLSMTVHKADIDAYKHNKEVLFFWIPHLAKLFDLKGLEKLQTQKKQAMAHHLLRFIKAYYVRNLFVQHNHNVHQVKARLARLALTRPHNTNSSLKRKRNAAPSFEISDYTRGLLPF